MFTRRRTFILSTAAATIIGLGAGDASAASCPVLESDNWTVWVESSGDDKYQLLIQGDITLPTPGFQFEWREGPMDRAMPPGWRIELAATPPEGLVAQVLTDERIIAMMPSPYPRYREIRILCGDTELAVLPDVTTRE